MLGKDQLQLVLSSLGSFVMAGTCAAVEAKLMVGAVDRMPNEAMLLLPLRSRPGNAELKLTTLPHLTT